jgi:hypothetical protein
MQSFRKHAVLILALMIPLGSSASLAGEPAAKPDLKKLNGSAEATLAALDKGPASWTMVQETPGGLKVSVDVYRTATMERYSVSASDGEETGKWAEIVARDGLWYVFDGKTARKCRPYEASLDLPEVYFFLVRSRPSAVDVTQLESGGACESVDAGVATYRVPLPAAARRQCETALRVMNDGLRQAASEGASASIPANAQESKRLMEDLLAHGAMAKIDLGTGLVVESGLVGKRLWLHDFRLLPAADPARFDVSARQWIDQSRPAVAADPADLVMIKNRAVWRPGQPVGTLEGRILNVKTGDCRRLPYQGADCVPICFSPDRTKIYLGGFAGDEAAMGLFEIDLKTLKHRRLGLPLLDSGFVMFGAISPDGKTLATSRNFAGEKMFDTQVLLVDIATGQAKPLGHPLDCANLSWLADGSGVVLVSRERELDQAEQKSTICRMDLQGRLTPLLEGDCPVALSPKRSILFQGKDRLWRTCDQDGKDTKQLLDGLSTFGFPTASPDGNRLLMMKFGGPDGPRPHIIDLATGKITPISVSSGIWAMPAWR